MEIEEKEFESSDVSCKDSESKIYIIAMIIEFIILVAATALLINFYVSKILIIGVWGISILYIILEKLKIGALNKILEIICTIIIILCVIGIYKGYQDKQFIKMVQKQEFLGIEYIDLFESFSYDVEWKCEKREKFTIIDSNEAYRTGSYEGVVKISGSCYIEDVEERYILTYYVSKERDVVVPKSLECAGVTYDNSTDIQTFINSVYRFYLQSR